MTAPDSASGASDFKNRQAGLIAFGILEIVLGAFCALMIPLVAIGSLASSTLHKGAQPAMTASMLIESLLVYIALATAFIWLGIGSIMARRWARALWLVGSWLWLISGVVGFIFMIMMLPAAYEQMSKSGQLSPKILAAMEYATFGFMGIFYIVLPGALVLFYGSRHTKATCERNDPRVRWTDRCPLPVLAWCLIFAVCAGSMPLLGFFGWVVPVFGTIVSGAAGAAVALGAAVLLAFLSWGMYRMKLAAWSCAVLSICVWGASVFITFTRLSLMDLYERMHFPSEQLAVMRPMVQGPWMGLMCGLWALIALACLLYVKRFFPRRPEHGASPAGTIGMDATP